MQITVAKESTKRQERIKQQCNYVLNKLTKNKPCMLYIHSIIVIIALGFFLFLMTCIGNATFSLLSRRTKRQLCLLVNLELYMIVISKRM